MTTLRPALVTLAFVAACSSSEAPVQGSLQDASPDATTTTDAAKGDADSPTLTRSITHDGITWTFDREVPSGVFITGDPWVVGPLTVVSVSPSPTAGRHGSMVNPKPGEQAYDDRGGQFDAEAAASFPLLLGADSSLVSSISKEEGAEVKNLGALRVQAVLTVVAAPQSPTAFRPAYAGAEKRIFDAQSMRDDILPNLQAPGSAPDTAVLAERFSRPRIDHLSSWTIQNSCAEQNWDNGPGRHACYGREYVDVVSHAALAVMLDTPSRDELARRLVQLGIDNHGVVRAGGDWSPNGGHHSGRKWPIVFAARMLDDCELLAVGQLPPRTFGEDGQTYYGENNTALFGQSCGSNQTYFQDGCSGGGSKDCRDPAGLVDGCSDYRDCCTSRYWIGEALAARLIGAVEIWNHDPFFDYVERWMGGEVTPGETAAGAFINDMWSAHRTTSPVAPPAASCP